MVVLDRNDVEDMATPPRSRWTTEAERLRLVRFHQAQEIIAAVSGGKSSLGCDVAGNIGGGVYAMLALIREGKGRVWKSATNAFLPSVTVSAHNIDCSRGPAGHYTLVEPGGKAFFLIPACVV
jgi:hypothetical protein